MIDQLTQAVKNDTLPKLDTPSVKPQVPRRVTAKIGRNDPCLCESGKKYKKCCGK
ncbi:SEC-C domain-containing protein [Shewanella sp. 202IG2-18]|nr:SEC-C domain-containing protein [Parashewanella hymeniacidonis]